MIRLRLVMLLLCLMVSSSAGFGQNAAKGFKALEAGDYAAARSNFEGVLAESPDDVAANFGMSRIHGIKAAGDKDSEKALEYLEKAKVGWKAMDGKGQGKLEKMGIGVAALDQRQSQVESSFLAEAKKINTVAVYDGFLNRFPDSKHVRPATNLRNGKALEEARELGTVAALDKWLQTYPDAEEWKGVSKERDAQAADEALKTDSVEGYAHFVSHYPEALQAAQMRQRLNAKAWEETRTANTKEAYQSYIEKYPDSIFLEQAKSKLEFFQNR